MLLLRDAFCSGVAVRIFYGKSIFLVCIFVSACVALECPEI